MRYYNNKSDERWKAKSLNPEPVEQYPIKLPSPCHQPEDSKDSKRDSNGKTREELLPGPKISLINDTVFCISIEN